MNFDSPPADPIATFRDWFSYAEQHSGQPNPNAMTLATVQGDQQPRARIVLLKDCDAQGFVFYTNYQSDKALELEANPLAALLFHWDAIDRQIRIEGRVQRVSEEESDAYFASRPHDSRIGAWASDQSRPVKNRAELDARVEKFKQQYPNEHVPRPSHWGGYRLVPHRIEFWQGHMYRLHDRVRYDIDDAAQGTWSVQRLYP